MIIAITGNLLELIEGLKLDGILSAANGKGPMGRGIAGAIKRSGGDEIQADAYKVCNEYDPQEGEAYYTIPGSLAERGIKYIIHSVTMKQPAGRTSLDICEQAFKSALELAEKLGITKLGCTALGTGVGGLDAKEIAKRMVPHAIESKVDVFFVDFNSSFINEVKKEMQD